MNISTTYRQLGIIIASLMAVKKEFNDMDRLEIIDYLKKAKKQVQMPSYKKLIQKHIQILEGK